ncbi:hypothetical protein BJL95_20915 [Methylomonas sp. LWB]|nr:hypothetical protein BJL95_20915 [Methylomonas sp. LWB]
MQLIHALKWSFLSEIASKAIQPIVFVILARLLTPEDYGIVAAASMVISFSQIFWEAGTSKALIQYQGDRNEAANAAFWINITLGILVSSALLALSNLISENIFHDPRVELVIDVLTLQVMLSALTSVHIALLQKDMQFKHLFWVRLVTVAIPAIISIPLAWHGKGYWALISGTLVGQLMQVLIIWQISYWKPVVGIDINIVKQLSNFGGWVATTGLLSWFYIWADSLIIGLYLGSHELGLYRTGNAIVTMIYGCIFGPLMPVLYSHFSEIQTDRERVRTTLFKVIQIITFLSIPMAVFLFTNASFISNALFSEKWKGIELVISVMALMHGYSWIIGANGEAYRAVGAPANETITMSLTLVFYIVGYFLSIQHGLQAFIWTRLALALAACGAHLWVAKRVVNLNIIPTVTYVAKISLVCLPLVAIAHALQWSNIASYETKNILIDIILLFISLWAVERRGLIQTTLTLVAKRHLK